MKYLHHPLLLVVLLCSLLPLLLGSEQSEAEDWRKELGRLDWLEGTWEGVQGGIWHQEVWRKAKGGMMLALHHEVQEATDRTLSFEYLRIEVRADGLYYVASPMGRAPTAFTLAEIGEHSAVFVNPEHDFPQRISYERDGDELKARVEGEGQQALSWRWKLVP